MKKKNTPFLDFYYDTIQSCELKVSQRNRKEDLGGLCSTKLDRMKAFHMIRIDAPRFGYWGFNGGDACWADGSSHLSYRRKYEFTPLRQNIVLLCAAINAEFEL